MAYQYPGLGEIGYFISIDLSNLIEPGDTFPVTNFDATTTNSTNNYPRQWRLANTTGANSLPNTTDFTDPLRVIYGYCTHKYPCN